MGNVLRRLVRCKPLRFTVELVEAYFDHRIARAAAAMAYNMLLCVFPLIIVAFAVVGLLPVETAEMLSWLDTIVPGASSSLFGDYAAYVLSVQSPALLTAGLAMTIMAASAAFRGMLCIFSEVTGHTVYTGLKYILTSIIMSLLLVLAIYASLLVVVTGRWFLNIMVQDFGLFQAISSWQWLRFPFLLALCILALSAIYRVSVSKRQIPTFRVLPGALAASAALTAGTALFSAFISMSSRYSLIYGSLASIIILMLWFYLCSNILVMGNVLNFVVARWRAQRLSGQIQPKPAPRWKQMKGK